MGMRRAWVASLVFVLTVVAVAAVGSSSADAIADGGGVFVPVTPVRLFDTSGTRLAAGSVKSVSVSTTSGGASSGVPASNVSAVVVDVTAKDTVASNVYAYSTDDTSPLAILSVGAGDVKDSNTVIVKVGSDHKFNLKVSSGSAEVNVDVQGYFTSTSSSTSTGGFVPVTPTRLVNTLDGTGIAQGKISGGSVKSIQVGGVGDIPSNASAVFANIRVQNASGDGGVRAGASSAAVSSQVPVSDYTSSGIYDSGASLDVDTSGRLYLSVSSGTSANLTIDVQGYFSSGTDGSGYHPLTNERVWDSRNSGSGALAAGETRLVNIGGLGGIPDDSSDDDPTAQAGAVILTINALNWTTSGSVAVYSGDLDDANGTSNVAWSGSYGSTPAQTTSVVEVSNDRAIKLTNTSAGPVDILLNAQGWFAIPVVDDSDTPPSGSTRTTDFDDMVDEEEAQCAKPLSERTGKWYCPETSSGTYTALQMQPQSSSGYCNTSGKGCWQVYDSTHASDSLDGFYGYGKTALGTAHMDSGHGLNGSAMRTRTKVAFGGAVVDVFAFGSFLYGKQDTEGTVMTGDGTASDRHRASLSANTYWYPWGKPKTQYMSLYNSTRTNHATGMEYEWSVEGYPGYWYMLQKSVISVKETKDDGTVIYKFGDPYTLFKRSVKSGYHASE